LADLPLDKIKNMKLILSTLLYILLSSTATAQTWSALYKPQIVKDGTGFSTHDQAYGIYEDASGNVYHTGYFEGEMTFGNSTIKSIGSRDIFIAKINKSGGWDWAVSAGGSSTDFSRDLTVDLNGNIYVVGYFYGTCNFGTHEITAQNNSDVFIAKLSPTGEWLWAKAAVGNGFNRGNSVTVDNTGHCYITGSFESTINLGNISISATGLRDIFVAKISLEGNWIWAVKAGGSNNDESFGMKYNNTNSCLVLTGIYTGNSSFGQTMLSGVGSRDIFVARLDSNGSWNWAKSAATSGNEESKAIALDGAGNAVITGYYTSSINFGNNNLPAGLGKDIFVAKIDITGNWLWAKNTTGANDQEAQSIALDNSGNAYLTGSFYATVNFGNTQLSAVSDRNLFVAKIGPTGNWIWAKSATGNSTIEGYGISVSSNGTSFITGTFYLNADFGNYEINTLGESDVFVARMTNSGIWSWVSSNGAVTGLASGESITLDSASNIITTGMFYGTIKFGENTLSSNGKSDFYVAKLKQNGECIWAVSFGGIGLDVSKSVAVDTYGSVYVTGEFEETIEFGDFLHTSIGFSDMFLIKLSSDGEIIWSKSTGDTDFDSGSKIIVKDDYIINAGIFSKKPYFGNKRLDARGNEDIFISKLDFDGNYFWTISSGGNQFETINGINVDIDKNILLTGGFEGTCYFGNKNVSSSGGDDIFIAKADENGDWKWVVKAGTSNFQEAGWAVESDENKNVYAVGTFRGLCLFGSTYIVNKGQNDFFISKLDSNGNWIWTKGIGGTGSDYAYDMVLAFGRIKITGAVSTSFIHEDKYFKANGLLRNAFLADFDMDGNILAVKSDEYDGFSEFRSLICDMNNSTYLTGNYGQKIKLGDLTESEISDVDKNAFIAIISSTLAKPNWEFRTETGISSTIVIPKNIIPTINGRNFVPGDAIGIFYLRNNNYYCAGMNYWDGEDISLTVWGDDLATPNKDGFTSNEKFNFRLWDVLKEEEISTKVRYESGPEIFMKDSISVISQLPIIYDTLRISLNQGWNIISTYSMPEIPLMDSVFKSIKNYVSLVKSSSGKTYIPQFNINTIGNWDITQGYQVYATQNTELVILGTFVQPESLVYNLNSGWSIISYIRNTEISPITAFSSLVNQNKLVLVKSADGKSYIPQFGINTIGNLKPKQGYQIYLSGNSEFVYPEND
jgi:hypothetical protein